MLKTLKKFFAFCGVDNRRLFMASIWLGVVSAICSAMRIPAAAIVIQALLQKNVTMATLRFRQMQNLPGKLFLFFKFLHLLHESSYA